MAVVRQLVVRRGSQAVLTFTLTGRPCTIGRSPDSDLVLPDAGVSPHHAEIRTESGTTVLTDVGSEGGTFIGGARLQSQQPRALEHGETFDIGPYQVVYRTHAAESRGSKRAAVPTPEPTVSAADVHPAVVLPSLAPAVSSSEGASGSSAADLADAPPEKVLPPVAGPGPTSRYMQYLPIIFHDSDFLVRFLQIFEAIWEPLELRQDHIDMYFSPRTCPAEWLPWLASWFGLTLEEHWPEAHKRALLTRALDIYRWRGTAYGLERIIEARTGSRPEIVITPNNPHVFKVTVRVPTDAGEHIDHDLEQLIAAHKPAHTGYILEILR